MSRVVRGAGLIIAMWMALTGVFESIALRFFHAPGYGNVLAAATVALLFMPSVLKRSQ